MKNRKAWGFFTLVLIFLIGMNIKVPYYIYHPGSALPLKPLIKVEDGYKDERGSFQITTIRAGQTNMVGVVWAALDPHAELVKIEQVRSPHESNDQYLKRQLMMMQDSQDTAKVVAFQKAGFDIELKNSGAIILQLIPGYPAEQFLEIGDVITEVDNIPIHTSTDLIQSLEGRAEGETVQLRFVRGEEQRSANITLKALPTGSGEESKAGIGIASPITKREYHLPKNVEIQSDNIGGPSAGLMFTLEIINQLTPGDLTKGYNIAGSGTINEDGTIGQIGGVEYKVVAAAREQVDIFFVPVEKDGSGMSNYEQAVKKAERHQLNVEIAPARNIDDVLRYLDELPPK